MFYPRFSYSRTTYLLYPRIAATTLHTPTRSRRQRSRLKREAVDSAAGVGVEAVADSEEAGVVGLVGVGSEGAAVVG